MVSHYIVEEKCRLVRYLNPTNYHVTSTTKADKDFAKGFDFKDIKFPVNIRDIRKIEKSIEVAISIFGYESIDKHVISVSKIFC